MYTVYNEDQEKVFGCSSLSAVIEYITEVGVTTVLSKDTRVNLCGNVRINLVNGEYVLMGFGCPTTTHDWITNNVPGELIEIVSRESGCEYRYK